MLAHDRRPVSLCLLSTDLPILSTLETAATLYQKDRHRFHLLLNQPPMALAEIETLTPENKQNKLIWLEISANRVIMTMQGQGRFSYRHFWEQGVFGVSRYWLNAESPQPGDAFRVRNYTRSLQLEGNNLPEYLRLEYELWSDKLILGHYVLHLQVHQ
ncbi:MAG: hypothetical protein GPJ20_18395 [Microcystis aeruginosa BS13-10]|uniref:Uncharacterized protein n=1 Tax=Microcystis aeruginosa G11-04 TaxID=2685956 RepID=A0A966L5S7_MICAE|nr:hypothetical protein [Microcystis aeruginosa LE13-04]NCS40790.1 hypothetical protein [Microcystis aeruginosa BS13-10]NCS58250.1 hypothetical protein [Microcystis aeruginosa G11-04]NCT44376.1 hypothetical protein [Microcystis aeruginosa G11-09]